MNKIILKKIIFFVIALIAIDGLFSSCNYNPDQFHGELRSDGYIRYSYKGNNIFIPDSIKGGDPSIFLLYGYYYRYDSVLNLQGSQFPIYGGINIQLAHCTDTGVFKLSYTLGSYASVNGWNTDTLHGGEVHLTQFDTTKGIVEGTFFFKGINKLLSPDSVSVDSGFIYNFPVRIIH